jgi:hypothetical protein
MTDASLPAGRFTPSDFRVGPVFSRTWSVLSRNFLTFVVVSAIPSLLGLFVGVVAAMLMPQPTPGADPFQNPGALVVGVVVLMLFLVLQTLVQAVLLYATFQVMRGRPIDLAESARIGLRRFFPVVGIAIIVPVLAGLASLLLVFPGFMLYTMWFVATPVCVVEQLGPVDSLKRSRMLTKGHRWKIFGIFVLLSLIFGVGEGVVSVVATGGLPSGPPATVSVSIPTGLTSVADIVNLLWNVVSTAFYAIFIVVTYHDLRVAKEGIDTDQIAAVFE